MAGIDRQFVAFDGVDRPVAFHDAADVQAVLSAILWGWRFGPSNTETELQPLIGVRREGDEYRLSAPWHLEDRHADTPVAAACTLSVDLVRAFIEANPGWQGLHCGAVEIDGRLVLLVGPTRAGKSTLVADLASRGVKIFTDDLVPVDFSTGIGRSMGIPPRPRLPLPADVAARVGNGTGRPDDRWGPRDNRYLYLRPDRILQAPFGATAPLGTLVFLDRRIAGPAALGAIEPEDAFVALILQTFSGSILIDETVRRVADLVASSRCIRLRYARTDEGASCLLASLKAAEMREPPGFPDEDPDFPDEDTLSGVDARLLADRRPATGRIDPLTVYRRVDDATEVVVGDRVFVANRRYGSVHALNGTARGIWSLLSEPLSLAEAVSIMCGAFPDISPKTIVDDMTALFELLLDYSLIDRVETS